MVLQLNDLKSFLNITDSNNDYRLQLLLASAYSDAESYTGRYFDLGNYTDYFGNLRKVNVVYPMVIPIQSIESVSVDGEILSPDSYEIANNRIVFDSYFDLPTCISMVVKYTAGWTNDTFPIDLKMAIFKLAIRNDLLSSSITDNTEFITFSSKEIYNVFEKYRYNII